MTDLNLWKRACLAYLKRAGGDIPEERFPAPRTSKVTHLSDDECLVHLRNLKKDILAVYRWHEKSERLAYCPTLTTDDFMRERLEVIQAQEIVSPAE